jgi:hypothetical protein
MVAWYLLSYMFLSMCFFVLFGFYIPASWQLDEIVLSSGSKFIVIYCNKIDAYIDTSR